MKTAHFDNCKAVELPPIDPPLASRSRSKVGVKSNKNHCQSKVFVCVSIISGRMRIIARMQSIGF